MIPRDAYLAQVRPFLGQPVIKVLTGIRRSGKSTILDLLRDDLLASGIPERCVIHLDYEVLGLGPLTDPATLLTYLHERIDPSTRTYLLVDEIQELEGWEKVVSAMTRSGNVDVTITGSNSRLLSSELATHIAGRYVSFQVWPLSFREHLGFVEAITGQRPTDLMNAFSAYLRQGGFPVTHLAAFDDEQSDRMVRDIYTSILIRDTLSRRQIRNTEMLERVVRFVFDNVGNTISANALAAYFKSQRRTIDPETVSSYLSALEEAFLITRVPRQDLRGKEVLRTQEKYYVGDHSLVTALLGYAPTRIQGLLENIVWAELCRRGYTVTIGKLGDKEIDFVADRAGDRVYVQVSYLIGGDPATLEREFGPLRDIADRYPAYVVSLDPFAAGNVDGIRHVTIPEFLLADTW